MFWYNTNSVEPYVYEEVTARDKPFGRRCESFIHVVEERSAAVSTPKSKYLKNERYLRWYVHTSLSLSLSLSLSRDFSYMIYV